MKPEDIFKLETVSSNDMKKAFKLDDKQWDDMKEIVQTAFSKNDCNSEAIKFIYNNQHLGLNARVLGIFLYGRAVEDFNATMEEGMMMKKMKKHLGQALEESND